jgi:hypothetical protein
MNLALWRQGLKAWLNGKMLVNTWELRNPVVYNTINAFLPPLMNISFLDGAVGEANAIQDIYLTSKYDGVTKYADLPIGELEQQYITIQRKMVLEFSSIAPLTQLEVITIPDAIQVIEDGEGLADWLVTMVFSVKISWIPAPTLLPGEVDKPITGINTITTGLFTSRLKPSNVDVPDYVTDFKNPARRSKVGDIKVT